MAKVGFLYAIALTTGALLVLQGCTVAATLADSPAVPLALSASAAPGTLQKIKTEIGDAACTSNAQCASLPLGAKACGGPETFMAWSSSTSSVTTLQTLASRYSAERRAQITANHDISTCSMVLAPAAVCSSAGHCVLQSGANGLTTDPR